MKKKLKKLIKLDPWFVTGFADAECCFSISIVRKNKLKVGWEIKIRFQINLHQKDKVLLQQIQSYFGVGSLYKYGSQLLQLCVFSVKDLAVIIDHFDKYPLITKKRADYELFKKSYKLHKGQRTYYNRRAV